MEQLNSNPQTGEDIDMFACVWRTSLITDNNELSGVSSATFQSFQFELAPKNLS